MKIKLEISASKYESVKNSLVKLGIGGSGSSFDKYIMVVCQKPENSTFSFELAFHEQPIKNEEIREGAFF